MHVITIVALFLGSAALVAAIFANARRDTRIPVRVKRDRR